MNHENDEAQVAETTSSGGAVQKGTANGEPSFRGQAVTYFVRAIVLVACLMLVAKSAPFWLSVFLPLFLVAYSLVATIGNLYFTVVKRLHKQHKLNKKGQLSRLNRKWILVMVGLLLVSLVSAFLFLLDSPKWDDSEWILIWLAIPLYFGIYQAAKWYLKNEYSPQFYKAYAMRWGFWITGVLLCIAYAVLSVWTETVEYSSLEVAFQSVYKPYSGAPSALMGDADKLASLFDGFTMFAANQATHEIAVFGAVWNFLVFASVIFGVLSQLNFCLLNRQEVKSEFQILPANNEAGSKSPILRRYIAVLVVFAVVAVLGFLALEFEVAKVRATEGYTAVDEVVDDQIEKTVFIVDGGYDEFKGQEARREQYTQERDRLLNDMKGELSQPINDYFDQCLDNMDSYWDWYNSPFGAFARQFKSLMRDDAKKTFMERVSSGADSAVLEDKYKAYEDQLGELQKEYLDVITPDEVRSLLNSGSHGAGSADSGISLGLWAILDEATIDDVLLCSEADISKEEMESKISELIEKARALALAKIGQS